MPNFEKSKAIGIECRELVLSSNIFSSCNANHKAGAFIFSGGMLLGTKNVVMIYGRHAVVKIKK